MNRTIRTLIIFLLLLSHPARSYTLEWASVCPSNTDFFPHDNVTDAAGNVYNTGRFRGTVDLDPTAGISSFTANGFTDAFIQKLDPAGNFLWAITYTGGSWEQINGLTIDGMGNLYAIGLFGGSVDFDPSPGVFSLTSNGGNDLVVLKLSGAGNLIWGISIGGVGNEEGLYIDCDPSGNIYCGGVFSLSVDFDPGPGTSILTSVGSEDICVFKLDPSGNHFWSVSFGTNSSEYFGGMNVSNSGDVILTGAFSGSGDFNPNAGVNTLNAVAFTDIFFVKLNSFGNYLWSSSLGSPGFDSSQDICFTTGGEILVVGAFNNTLDFDPGPGTFILTPTSLNGYLLKLDAAGSFLWVNQFIGLQMIPLSIDINPVGKIILSGSFRGTVDFDSGPGVVSVSASNVQDDAFVLSLDNTGVYEWHIDPEGSIGFDQIFAMTISSVGHIFFMGRFSTGTIDLLSGPGVMSVTNSAIGSGNGFFFKLNAGGSLPVEWGFIEALQSDKKIVINWTTLSETNNDYFEIERSSNALEWTVIGRESSRSNSNQVTVYKHNDLTPKKGILYYRIRQIDLNGNSELSKVVAVRYNSRDDESINLTIQPNTHSAILWSVQIIETESVELFSADGHLVQKMKNISLPFEMDLSHLSSQLLYVRVSYNDFSTTIKLPLL